MNKIKEVEYLLVTWKAKADSIPSCDQEDYWEARHTADGLALALEILKRSSNKVVEDGQADTCTCYQKGTIYGCGICQNCGKNLPAT